jgi:membrane-associated phospholipid phosphatase
MKKTLLASGIVCFSLFAKAQQLDPPDSLPAVAPAQLSISADTIADSTNVLKEKKAALKLYHFRPAADIPLVALTAGWSAFAFTKIYSKDPSTEQEIMNLDRNDIPAIDRWAAGMSDENADANSNYFFYGSIPVPFALFLDKKIRKDAAKISYLYLEAMSITGLFYTGSVFLVDRYRPETYDTNLPVEDRLSGNNKDAFLAGHPALVATSLFFTAKVFADYHPDSKWKYALYGAAIAGTGATAYLRHIAGKHFPTDLLTGVTLGTACGILVPQLHKYRKSKTADLGFLPYLDGNAKGFTMICRFR